MNKLRKARFKEAKEILDFYSELIKSFKYSSFNPKWNDKYPNLEFIKNSIEREELYIYRKNDELIASVIVNCTIDEYNADWIVDAKDSEITAIHTFAVNPKYSGKGIGREIFEQIKNTSLTDNKKTIRIEVIDGNDGALDVFKKLGFKYIGCAEAFHEAVGMEKFHLHEYPLK